MWSPKSRLGRRFGPALSTIWPQKVGNQEVNGCVEIWLEVPEKWPARLLCIGSSDQTAKKLSGPAASLCRPLMAAELLKTGQKSLLLFSKKWALTKANMPGRLTVIRMLTITSTSDCVGSEAVASSGIRSTQQEDQSRPAPNWRLNLT